jgi:hypothetical protein
MGLVDFLKKIGVLSYGTSKKKFKDGERPPEFSEGLE